MFSDSALGKIHDLRNLTVGHPIEKKNFQAGCDPLLKTLPTSRSHEDCELVSAHVPFQLADLFSRTPSSKKIFASSHVS